MEITETRIFLKEGQDKKLKAYATVTFDQSFVVRNIKVIQGASGLFIAMPSRKMKTSCKKCHAKNEIGGRYCSQCGAPITAAMEDHTSRDAKTEHRDIAHPVTQQFRDYLQEHILAAYQQESEKIQRVG